MGDATPVFPRTRTRQKEKNTVSLPWTFLPPPSPPPLNTGRPPRGQFKLGASSQSYPGCRKKTVSRTRYACTRFPSVRIRLHKDALVWRRPRSGNEKGIPTTLPADSASPEQRAVLSKPETRPRRPRPRRSRASGSRGVGRLGGKRSQPTQPRF